METRPSLVIQSPEVVSATVGAALVTAWIEPATPRLIREIHRVSRELKRGHADGIAHINLVVPSTRVDVTEELRTAVMELLRDPAIGLVAAAIVIDGGGFLGSIVRSVLSSAVLLARSSVAVKFAAGPREVERWLAEDKKASRLAIASGAVQSAVGLLRETIGPRAVDRWVD